MSTGRRARMSAMSGTGGRCRRCGWCPRPRPRAAAGRTPRDPARADDWRSPGRRRRWRRPSAVRPGRAAGGRRSACRGVPQVDPVHRVPPQVGGSGSSAGSAGHARGRNLGSALIGSAPVSAGHAPDADWIGGGGVDDRFRPLRRDMYPRLHATAWCIALGQADRRRSGPAVDDQWRGLGERSWAGRRGPHGSSWLGLGLVGGRRPRGLEQVQGKHGDLLSSRAPTRGAATWSS